MSFQLFENEVSATGCDAPDAISLSACFRGMADLRALHSGRGECENLRGRLFSVLCENGSAMRWKARRTGDGAVLRSWRRFERGGFLSVAFGGTDGRSD